MSTRTTHRPLLLLAALVLFAVPTLAGAGEVAVEPEAGSETAPLAATSSTVPRSVEPEPATELGLPEPILQSGVCNLPEGEYYYLCHGYCYDGSRCAKKCSWETHECCQSPLFCLDPSVLCFE